MQMGLGRYFKIVLLAVGSRMQIYRNTFFLNNYKSRWLQLVERKLYNNRCRNILVDKKKDILSL